MPITDFHTYGKLIYSLQKRYASVRRSTLVLATIGPTLAKLEGQVIFENDVVLEQPNLPTLIKEIESEVLPSSPGIS